MDPNLTSDPASDCVFVNYNILELAVPSMYFLMLPFALLFNGVAAWVALHLRSSSTFIVYLKNLVAADLLMSLTFPLRAASILPSSPLGLRMFVCRFSDTVFYSCMYMSISLMGLISLDRFFKVVRPGGRLLGQNLLFSRGMSASLWIILFGGAAFPTMILTDEPSTATNTTESCMNMKGVAGQKFHTYSLFFLNVLFWTVSGGILICYVCISNKVLQSFRNSGSSNSQGKKKTKLRVFLVLIVFVVCFGPYHIVRVPYTLLQTQTTEDCTVAWVKVLKKVTLWLSTTNVCLDPFLYVFLCKNFREKLVAMIQLQKIPEKSSQ